MRRAVVLACLVGLSLSAQSPPKIEFDVVSVKLVDPGTGGVGDRFPQRGTWNWTGIRLSGLITYAYGVSQVEIANIPAKFQSRDVAFGITAKMPVDVTHDQFRAMLESMLADRFAFAMHREMREVPVVTIDVAKGGSKLKPASGDCVHLPPSAALPAGQRRCGEVTRSLQIQDGILRWQYSGRSISMADLATFLSDDGPVVDNTGIKGLYDLDVTVEAPTAAPPTTSDEAANNQFEFNHTFNAAFEKQAGLSIDKNKLSKRPISVIVVDHVDLPTPN